MLFITHNLGVVACVADSVLVMDQGEMCESGPVARVLEQPEPRVHAPAAAPPRRRSPRPRPAVKSCERRDRRWRGGRPGASVAADVLIEDGPIAAVGEVDRDGATVVDASGCLVLPGAIDVHTHVFGGIRDDTRSALLGGTTCALAFVDALDGRAPGRGGAAHARR